jgi:hypothetical protein
LPALKGWDGGSGDSSGRIDPPRSTDLPPSSVFSSSPQDERGGQPAAWCHQMPWTSNEAERHTHKATTPALQQLWTKVANETLERTGDEGRAIREANAVVARQPNAGS